MSQKILYINQEMTPYVPETFLAAIGRELPQYVQEQGYEVRTFMPKWGNINERRGQLHPVQRLSGMNIIIDETDQPLIIKVASIPMTRIQVYFIDNDDYFAHLNPEQEEQSTAADNGERAIFFARGILEAVKKQRWAPDIIHCQGWLSAVFPFYVKTAYKDEPVFANTKVVTSLFDKRMKRTLGAKFKKSLPYKDISPDLLKAYKPKFDFIELGKLAIDYSDAVVEANSDVNAKLIAYAKEAGRETMPYTEDKNKYIELYHRLTGQNK